MNKQCNECDYYFSKDKPCKWCREKNLYNPKKLKFMYYNLKTNKNTGGSTMLRIPVLNLTRYVEREQLGKVLEEASELYDAIDLGDIDEICSECLDVIQSAIGMLLMSVTNKQDLIKQILRHEIKLKSREARGLLEIKGWLNIEHQEDY